MASLLIAAGADHIITMAPHAAQTQAFFSIPWVTSMQNLPSSSGSERIFQAEELSLTDRPNMEFALLH